MALETHEKPYLRNAFVVGSVLFAIPLVYGAFQGFPKDFYLYMVPPLAGLLVIVYALENSIRHLRQRIELLEDDAKDRSSWGGGPGRGGGRGPWT